MLCFLLLVVSFTNAQNVEYYISPTGSDSNIGTFAAPFQSLEKARDEIRMANHPGHVTVWLMDGNYYRNTTFELTQEDSGTANAQITYAALNKHGAVLNFNKAIPVSDFSPITDPALIDRLTPEALGNVVQLDLGALGIQNIDTWPDKFSAEDQNLIRLYAGTDLLPLSRYPNDSMMTMKEVFQNEPGIFEYRGNRHHRWLEAVNEGLWLQGFWRVEWQYDGIRTYAIDTIARTVTQAVAVAGGIGSKYHRPQGNGLEHYIATNLLDEIDLPGEWSVNFNTQMLYIWIPNGVSEITILDNESPVFRMNDVSNVNIENIKFDYGLGSAIEMNDGHDNLIAGCEMSNFIKYVVEINNGFNHEVISNDMHHLGSGGISLSGGDRYTLTPANHRAVNNHIYEFAIIDIIYAGAISIPARGADNNVGMYVAHNKIHGTPHVGVEYGGNNNLFEYNEIYDFCRVSGDMGGFYTYNDPSGFGNVFRYNYVHDAPGLAHAFYLDGSDGGDMFHNNIAQNLDIGVFIQGGRDVTVHNNLMVDCDRGVLINSALTGIVGTPSYTNWLQPLLTVDYQNPPWSDYVGITALLNGDFEGYPAGCSIDCNVGINTPDFISIDAATAANWGVDLGTNYADPSTTLDNATLVEIAAACFYNGKSCIDLIPYDKIGLITDEYRTVNNNPPPVCDDSDDCTISDQFDESCKCIGIYQDTDSDGICDDSDACPNDASNDSDADGVCDDQDICLGFDDNGSDADGDNIPDACDVCPNDPENDPDNDGICSSLDSCPNLNNNLFGTACDDGDPCSELSVYDANCNCVPEFNFALLGTPSMSSHYFAESVNSPRLIDGVFDNSDFASTSATTPNEWMDIDLGAARNIDEIIIWNRTNCCADRLSNVYVLVSNNPFPTNTDLNNALAIADYTYQLGDVSLEVSVAVNVSQSGRYIRLQKSGINPGGDILNIQELQIMGDSLQVDSDNDFVCDNLDICPGFDDNLVRTLCDDGDPCTDLSIYDSNCNCVPSYNYSLVGTPLMSSHYFGSEINLPRLSDGLIDNVLLASTNASSPNEWMQMDLGSEVDIEDVIIWNRSNCCSERLSNVYVLVSRTAFPNTTDLNAALANAEFTFQLGDMTGETMVTTNVAQIGRYVRIQKSGNNPGGDILNILELQIMVDSTQVDSDNDGVCDLGDTCPNGNDSLDANSNGLADDCEAVELSLSVILAGAFDASTNLMRTNLTDRNLLPPNQPYSVAPYNYMGTESRSTFPSNTVDWILVEARTGPTNTFKIDTKAGLLLNDGSIVDTDGVSPLLFDLPTNSEVYFVLRHRNHLDIMTASSMIRSLSMNYDFRTTTTTAFGIDQQKALPNGQAAMFPADINQDHVIQTTDYNNWKASPAILNIYDTRDVNLDGTVQTTDFDLWFQNKAKLGPAETAY